MLRRIDRIATGDELEDGIAPQSIVIVLILVVGQDSVNALADHVESGVRGSLAGLCERVRELL